MSNTPDPHDLLPERYPLTPQTATPPLWLRITAWAALIAATLLALTYIAAPDNRVSVCDTVTGERVANMAARHGGAYSDGHWIVDGIDLGAARTYDSGLVACAPEGTPAADEIRGR